MNRCHKFFVFAIGLLLSGTAMAAGSLTVAVQGTAANKAAFDKVIPEFEAQFGAKVTMDYIGGNYGAVVTTRLQGSNAPDIVGLVPGGSVPHSVYNIADSQRLADLSNAPWIGKISPETLPLVSSGGKVYAWPATVQVSGLIVNDRILREHNLKVPETLTELYAICGKLHAAGLVPVGWSGMPETRSAGQATTVAGSVGAAAVAINAPIASGKATYSATPQWVAVMNVIDSMRQADCFDPDSASMTDSQAVGMMLRGEAVMMMNNTQMLGVLLSSDTNKMLDLRVYPFPAATAAERVTLITPYDALAVTAKSRSKDMAIKFIDFLTKPEIQRQIAATLGNLAPIDTQENTLPEALAPLTAQFESGKVGINPVMFWRGGRLYLAMSKGVQGLLTGQLRPADVVGEMDRVNAERQ